MNSAATQIRVVLIRPTHPGNVGAAARALKNMGLERLYVVAPAAFPHVEATARAAGAEDLLAGAVLSPDLDAALAECHYVLGTSARPRHIGWPMLEPAEAGTRLVDESRRGPVALLFGQERSGLTNAELDRCHALVQIPANPAYPSLNLAAAVQVLAYEIRRALGLPEQPRSEESEAPPASANEMEHFYRHLEEVLVDTGFLDPANPRLLMRRLRRLFNRARPDQNEMAILRGILSAVQRVTRKS
ncbi:RNA methyltransferase [Sulfurifustis variabilis]|uniref:tRNA (cytidine/uridine-2'-O-)-methyltransferase TrmJ n=1 Tax=Sulfurifustis variabilis TaxID=1675686 RepID=A0A1B4VBM9_9GAMM|nr:RNA methyltransferase [Sulfurifustis variabilis]BAU48131.1 RNA methyltransferase [Sulfurifustis variabilis]